MEQETYPGDMTVSECLEHLEEIKSRQKTVAQDEAVKFAIIVIRSLAVCARCDGSGTMMVPDNDGESAYEVACPNPLHEIERDP